jgi:hypothetical protein
VRQHRTHAAKSDAFSHVKHCRNTAWHLSLEDVRSWNAKQKSWSEVIQFLAHKIILAESLHFQMNLQEVNYQIWWISTLASNHKMPQTSPHSMLCFCEEAYGATPHFACSMHNLASSSLIILLAPPSFSPKTILDKHYGSLSEACFCSALLG